VDLVWVVVVVGCGWIGWLEIEGKVFCEGWNLIQKYLLH